MRVIVGCESSGIVRDAFASLGHDAWSCDYLPTERPGKHIQGDILSVIDNGWDLGIFHPPCTRLTNSGVRWLHVPPKGKSVQQMWDELEEGVAFYKALRAAPIARMGLENPIMHKHARERIGPMRRQIVQPWWFGDPFFKATGFELIGLPDLVATNRLVPPEKGTDDHKAWSAVHRAPPGPDRWKDRSRTFPGVAAAMAAQWGA